MPFFDYIQNNSGGSFINDETVSYTVIIEANNASEANDFATEKTSIYFNGCDGGDFSRDCPCCGDRWSRQYGEGTETPQRYSKPIEKCNEMWAEAGEVYAIVYYKDGRVVKHIKGN